MNRAELCEKIFIDYKNADPSKRHEMFFEAIHLIRDADLLALYILSKGPEEEAVALAEKSL